MRWLLIADLTAAFDTFGRHYAEDEMEKQRISLAKISTDMRSAKLSIDAVTGDIVLEWRIANKIQRYISVTWSVHRIIELHHRAELRNIHTKRERERDIDYNFKFLYRITIGYELVNNTRRGNWRLFRHVHDARTPRVRIYLRKEINELAPVFAYSAIATFIY